MNDQQVIREWFATRATKPKLLSGVISSVTYDSAGKQTSWSVNVGGNAITVKTDLLSPELKSGDSVVLQQYGADAAATYHPVGATGESRPYGAMVFQASATGVGNTQYGLADYASGDVVFGNLLGGNIWIEYATGYLYHRQGTAVNGIEYADGTQIFGHCASSGSTYYVDGPNVYISSSFIQFRNASDVQLEINASGKLTISSSSVSYTDSYGDSSPSVNTILAGPSTGGSGFATYRLLTANDIPSLSAYLPIVSSPEQGDLLYYTGASWVGMPHGNTGQMLLSGGHGASPYWGNTSTLSKAIVSASQSPYTILTSDYVLYCDATAGSISVLLPAATATNRILYIKKADSGSCNVVISGSNSDTIDGETSQTLNAWETITLQDYLATTWAIL